MPRSFLESNFATRAEYEKNVLLPEAEQDAAEAAEAERQKAVSGSQALPAAPKRPTAIIVIGMAGSGKTTLMQRINVELHASQTPYYMVNLDPAVLNTPFGASVDIRDTVNYKELMAQYKLGPNGAILTALNLFATRFEQVLGLVERRCGGENPLEYAVFDTPGQIEIFTWSASGEIIAASLGATFPTVVVYVVDMARCKHAVTFMSNMLYACSILYKLKLPLVLAFNKIDDTPCDYAFEWMEDLDKFTAALQTETSYIGTLSMSMALMLQEFYSTLEAVGVSALSGEGMDDFFVAIDKAAKEYDSTYAVELRKKQAERAKKEKEREEKSRRGMRADGLEAAGAQVVMGSDQQQQAGRSRAAQDAESSDEDRGGFYGGEGSDDDPDDDEVGYGGARSGGAGYTAADEQYNKEQADTAKDREELESLRRYLEQQKIQREG